MRCRQPSLCRTIPAVSITATGLTAGMFTYGAVNMTPTFRAVPLDVRFMFHSALMKSNRVVMQSAMAVSIVSTAGLATGLHRRARWLAASASVLGFAAFGITRLGNVPINRSIRQWPSGGPPEDHAKILARWDTFNRLRTGASIGMFALTVAATGQDYRPGTQDSWLTPLR